MLLRIKKLIFTIKILQNIKIKRKHILFKQSIVKIKINNKEKKASTKIFAKFVKEVYSKFQELSLAKKRELQNCKY